MVDLEEINKKLDGMLDWEKYYHKKVKKQTKLHNSQRTMIGLLMCVLILFLVFLTLMMGIQIGYHNALRDIGALI